MNVTLIGTLHNDIHGKERLEKLLYHLKPEVLSVEGSAEMKVFNQQLRKDVSSVFFEKGITSHDSIETFMELSGFLPFEWDVCEKYSNENNIPLYWVELAGVALEMGGNTANFLDKLRDMPTEKLQKKIKKMEKFMKSRWKQHMLDLVGYNNFLLKGRNQLTDRYILGERDVHMYKRIKEISKDLHPKKKIVHVGGAQHMVTDYNLKRTTIASLLPDSDVYLLAYADTL